MKKSIMSLFTSVLITAVPLASAAPATPTVVLVHGAFADGSSWSKVIPLLQSRGINVVAVQNPLTSLADDVAATRRVLEQQTGPVVLVGHSWAGVVITEAGNDSKVRALVYVAAFSPDNGQSINDILKDKPAPSWAASLRQDSSGGMTLSEQAIREDFAPDLPRNEAQVIFSTQGPWSGNCLGDKVSQAAWHDKKSWAVVATNDRMIDPNLQIAMASEIHAHTIRVAASHALLLSQPKQVADAIIEAVKSVD